MDVYLVVGILKPTQKGLEEGEVAKIVFQPQAVIAKDKSQAIMKAHRLLPPDSEGKEDRLEILAMPFHRGNA
jgi:predicted DNA-binding antitoxin AbrB/MazE fold protein